VDVLTAPLLERALHAGDRDGAAASVVDLTRVEFLGVAGLRVLYSAATRAAARKRWFAVVADMYAVLRVLDLVDLGRSITRFERLSGALQAADRSTTAPVRR
jgi:anti-sigma B factor antagonist